MHINNASDQFDLKKLKTNFIILGIWIHLGLRRRIQLAIAFLIMLVSGISEVVSLAAVLPLLVVLSEPQKFWDIPKLQPFAHFFGFDKSNNTLVIAVVIIFCIVVLLAAAIRLLSLWVNGRLAAAIGSDLSVGAYKCVLHQPYSAHLQRNTSEFISSITTQTLQTVLVVNAFLQLSVSFIIAFCVLCGLLYVNVLLSLTAFFSFGGMYYLLSISARKKLVLNSNIVSESSHLQLKELQIGLGSIRDVLLASNQKFYVSTYRKIDKSLRLSQAQSNFLAGFPKYIVESAGIGLIAFMGLFLKLKSESSELIVPVLGTLAAGCQRLLPALQQIYGNWALIKARQMSVLNVLSLLNQSFYEAYPAKAQTPLHLRDELNFNRVSFGYNDNSKVFDTISFTIKKGQRIGIVGSSGSGKSTLVDLMMGLLKPSSGSVCVDGLNLHDISHPERLIKWRSSIAHVPQNVYLSDASIIENIAYGVKKSNIDFDRAKKAAEKAKISDFIESQPGGYEMSVGERGSLLSGGQRQRIGLARALYMNLKFLVLDEFTSALDSLTEESVLKSVESLDPSYTLIIISHRMEALKECDFIFRLENNNLRITKNLQTH